MFLQTKDYKTFTLSSAITFSDYKQANHCLPGDTVDWKDNRCVLVQRANHRFIPGILEFRTKYVYGHTSRGAKIYLFHPYDKKYPPFRVGSTSRDTSLNQIGLVEFMEWEDSETMPRGNLLRLLGPCGDLEAERKALTYQYSNPKLSAELFDIEDVSYSNRISLEGFTFNIDPDGCLDIDDVLTLKQISPTEWEFVITISDVAAHITEGSEGDRHASIVGQTLYQNGEAVVPMLPAALSEMALSLRANEAHCGISLFCRWDTTKKQLTVDDFKETVFKNNMSFTYETIYKVTEFPLHILEEIASSLHGSPTSDSHEWVAECMLLYNKQVAQKLLGNSMGLLRTHKPAKAEVLQFFTSLHPDLKALAYESAKYEPTGENKIHAGLGCVPYCHASSPIRRYADLINQRCLKAILQNKTLPPIDTSVTENLNRIQKQMRSYERSLFFLEQINKNTTGHVEGLVVESTDTKTKVYIPSWKHMIRIDAGVYTIGQSIGIDYYADLQKPSWEQRMVFRVQ